MKLPFYTFCAIFLWLNSIQFCNAQSYVPSLTEDVMPGNLSETNLPIGPSCFDPVNVFNSCQKIWVKVNLHFFLDDNCAGDVAMGPCDNCNLAPQNIAAMAEELILRTNAFADNMSDNIPFPNELEKTGFTQAYIPPCFPVRFLLKGVYVHCNSDFQQISGGDLSQFWVNPENEINIMFTEIAGSPFGNPTGYASYFGDYIVSEAIDWAGPSVLLHELAHITGIRHPWDEFGSYNLSDTWNPVWEWDHDCNPSTFPIVDEACWNNEPTFNGESACDGNFCTEHPCCGWTMQTTNLMAYSGWAANAEYATISPQQAQLMLSNLSSKLCDKIEYVGDDCPPPTAVVTSIPEFSDNSCKICFDFSASMNEISHQFSLYETAEMNKLPFQTTGWVAETARRYCINLKSLKNNANQSSGGLMPGNSYTAELTIRNECGTEDKVKVPFIVPDETNCMEQVVSADVFPNPAVNEATITLKPWNSALPKVRFSHLVYGTSENQTFETEMHENMLTIRFNTTGWKPGLHVAHITGGGEIYPVTIVKE